jgi:hypothetical protein
MIKTFSILIFSLLVQSGFTQIPLVPFDSIPVTRDSQLLTNAWAGGLNCPQFSEIDLNGDGKKDLVIFERNFYGTVKTFINTGSNELASYKYDPSYRVYFPPMRNWMLLRDYNCDGKEDIFTAVPAGIAVYRNDSDGSKPKFTKVTSLLSEEGLNGTTPVYVSPPDIPAIVDVDGDGDLDILSFNIVGSTVEYHKNISMELYGNCDELAFELKNTCWGYFIEDNNNNNVTLFDTCEVNVPDPEKRAKHPGSTLLAIDLSGNGVKDLLIGDINYPNMVKLTNSGTTSGASMTAVETTFPPNTQAINLTMFPAAYFLDVDNDGLKDLIVSPNNPNTSENYNNVWFYKNQGTETLPEFAFQKSNFLIDDMLDTGERSYPAFFDENNDGLMDIVVGSFGYFEDAGVYSSRLMLLRNTGTMTDPAFDVVTDDYSELAQLGFNGIYPAFGDLDGDGDLDMITGDEDGRLHYFRNDGGPQNPADFTLADAFYFDIDVGQSAKPQIVDVNRDGLPDLLVGERSGTVNYFGNSGTPEEALFSENPTIETFGNLDVMPECCTGYSAPFLTTDSTGNSILYVGSEQGFLYLFRQIDGNLDGTFELADSLYTHTINLSLSGADIDKDGHPEFVTGELAGGIGLLKKGTPPSLNISESGKLHHKVNVFPNPADNYIVIKIQPPHNLLSIGIFDAMGSFVKQKVPGKGTRIETVDISNLQPGFYLVSIKTGEHKIIKKILIK